MINKGLTPIRDDKEKIVSGLKLSSIDDIPMQTYLHSNKIANTVTEVYGCFMNSAEYDYLNGMDKQAIDLAWCCTGYMVIENKRMSFIPFNIVEHYFTLVDAPIKTLGEVLQNPQPPKKPPLIAMEAYQAKDNQNRLQNVLARPMNSYQHWIRTGEVMDGYFVVSSESEGRWYPIDEFKHLYEAVNHPNPN